MCIRRVYTAGWRVREICFPDLTFNRIKRIISLFEISEHIIPVSGARCLFDSFSWRVQRWRRSSCRQTRRPIARFNSRCWHRHVPRVTITVFTTYEIPFFHSGKSCGRGGGVPFRSVPTNVSRGGFKIIGLDIRRFRQPRVASWRRCRLSALRCSIINDSSNNDDCVVFYFRVRNA